jgi:hypothetical protein
MGVVALSDNNASSPFLASLARDAKLAKRPKRPLVSDQMGRGRGLNSSIVWLMRNLLVTASLEM